MYDKDLYITKTMCTAEQELVQELLNSPLGYFRNLRMFEDTLYSVKTGSVQEVFTVSLRESGDD